MSERREEFRRRVEELVHRFEGEVDRAEWITRRYPKRLRDENQEVYEVTALTLQKGPTRLILDPIGYDMPGAEGAVDLYLMPTYDPEAGLYFEGGRWMVHYTFPPEAGIQTLPLSTEAINQVLDSIAEHATPSV